MKHVGQTLKEVIEQRGLQRNQVAVKTGISPTYLSAIFHKESIDASLLERICKVVGVSPMLFFDEAVTYSTTLSERPVAQPGAARDISNGEYQTLLQLLLEKERTIKLLLKAKGILADED